MFVFFRDFSTIAQQRLTSLMEKVKVSFRFQIVYPISQTRDQAFIEKLIHFSFNMSLFLFNFMLF